MNERELQEELFYQWLSREGPEMSDAEVGAAIECCWEAATRFASDRHDAEDISQETMLRLFTYRGTTKPPLGDHRVTKFVQSVCRNVAADSWRERQRLRFVASPNDERFAYSSDHETWTAELEELEVLSPCHRDIIRLRLAGHSTAAVAAEMGLPLRSVHNALQEVRETLSRPERESPSRRRAGEARIPDLVVFARRPSLAQEEADESVRLLHRRLGLVDDRGDATGDVNWDEVRRLLAAQPDD